MAVSTDIPTGVEGGRWPRTRWPRRSRRRTPLGRSRDQPTPFAIGRRDPSTPAAIRHRIPWPPCRAGPAIGRPGSVPPRESLRTDRPDAAPDGGQESTPLWHQPTSGPPPPVVVTTAESSAHRIRAARRSPRTHPRSAAQARRRDVLPALTGVSGAPSTTRCAMSRGPARTLSCGEGKSIALPTVEIEHRVVQPITALSSISVIGLPTGPSPSPSVPRRPREAPPRPPRRTPPGPPRRRSPSRGRPQGRRGSAAPATRPAAGR